jgi:hypothetical protein
MKNNILFTFPDWEERAFSGFIRNIDAVPTTEIVLINYQDGLHASETAENVARIRKAAGERQITITDIVLSKVHSIFNWNILEKRLVEMNLENTKVFLDITTMPREIIWMILYNLKNKKTDIGYFYHKPSSYNPDWLTREPDTPRLLFKHSGIMDPEKQTALLVIPGFDSERVGQLINFFDPKKVILGIQTGTQFNNLKRNNIDELTLEMSSEVTEIDAYADDMGFSSIRASTDKLRKNYNIVIASLGPKLTALSMYRLYQQYPDIALCYIPCKDFNLTYSTGTGEMIRGDFVLN